MRSPSVDSGRHHARYLAMRDGVRIALDIWLPATASARTPVPAILHQTRYYRAVDWRLALRALGVPEFLDVHDRTRRAFVAAGYAWIDVDTRGSGASFGARLCPWSPDEVRDGAEVADWIVAQPWSSGAIGATGVSYGGTSAEMLLCNGHPAVRAVAPRFSLYDVYTDVAFPGGLHLAWFTEAWSRFNRDLDRGAYHAALARAVRANIAALRAYVRDSDIASWGPALAALDRDGAQGALAALVRLATRGVAPVAGDRAAAARAAAEHADNTDVHAAALRLRHRDDVGALPSHPDDGFDLFSPHAYKGAIAASGAAIYGYSGWLDGAYQNAAIKRHRNLPRGQGALILGPWDHGGRQDISPFSAGWRSDFDHAAELLRFFDRHLRHTRHPRRAADGGALPGPPVRYYTLGQERWKSADTWPPAGIRGATWRLAAGFRLVHEPGDDRDEYDGFVRNSDTSMTEARAAGVRHADISASDDYRVDTGVGTGPRSRWRSLIGLAAPVGYGDRADVDRRLLCYTSAPLASDLTITGHPVAHLYISADGDDGGVFAYLEDVAPSGRVTYITEGQLRISHRALADTPPYDAPVPQHGFRRHDAQPLARGEIAHLLIELLPISYRVRRGHAVRLAIAGADHDHFAPVTPGVTRLRVHRDPDHPSRLRLPIEP